MILACSLIQITKKMKTKITVKIHKIYFKKSSLKFQIRRIKAIIIKIKVKQLSTQLMK